MTNIEIDRAIRADYTLIAGIMEEDMENLVLHWPYPEHYGLWHKEPKRNRWNVLVLADSPEKDAEYEHVSLAGPWEMFAAPPFDCENYDTFKWDVIKDRLAHEPSVFIGSVFVNMPSGKFYVPFACSNLDKCSACNGTSKVPSPLVNDVVHHLIEAERTKLTKDACAGGKSFSEWTLAQQERARVLDNQLRILSPTIQCPLCRGFGSVEAYHDDLFRDYLEKKVGNLGAWLESGEGDPCDMFICRAPKKGEEGYAGDQEEEDDGERFEGIDDNNEVVADRE